MKNIIGWWIFLGFLSIITCVSAQNGSALNEEEMRNKLLQHNREAEILCNVLRRSMWNVSTDIGNTRKESERVSVGRMAVVMITFMKRE